MARMSCGIYAHHVNPNAPDQTYDVSIFGKTVFITVTASSESVDAWIHDILSRNCIITGRLFFGLDVKRSPTHERKPIATIQLCTGDRCLVYLIHKSMSRESPLPPVLHYFLSHPSYTFLGVGIKSKLEMLQNDYSVGGNAVCGDLGNLAASYCHRPELNEAGLSDLAIAVLGKDVERPDLVDNDWYRSKLSDMEVHCACIDAIMPYEIGKELVTPRHKVLEFTSRN